MRLLSDLFSNWGGPFHLRSCHFSSKSRRKYSFLRVGQSPSVIGCVCPSHRSGLTRTSSARTAMQALHQHPIKLASGDGTAYLPRAVKARAVGVATAERVRTREGDNLLVSEAHAVEDVPDVVSALVAVRKAAVRGAVLDVAASVTESDSVRERRPRRRSATTHPSLRPALQGIYGPPSSCTAQTPARVWKAGFGSISKGLATSALANPVSDSPRGPSR